MCLCQLSLGFYAPGGVLRLPKMALLPVAVVFILCRFGRTVPTLPGRQFYFYVFGSCFQPIDFTFFERHSQAKRVPSLFLFKFGTAAHTLPWHHLGFPIKSPLVFYHLSNMNFTSFRFDPTPIETDIPPLVLSTSIQKSPNTPQAPMYPTDVSRPRPNS